MEFWADFLPAGQEKACRWISAKLQGHQIAFGITCIFLNFPGRYHLGSPCHAWNLDPVFCRQAKNNCVDGFCKIPETLDNAWHSFEIGTRGIFLRPGHVPRWVVRGLGNFSFSGLLGATRGLGISSGPEHFARCGGPRTRGILSPSRGMRMCRSSLRPQFCGRRWAWEGEGRIEAT